VPGIIQYLGHTRRWLISCKARCGATSQEHQTPVLAQERWVIPPDAVRGEEARLNKWIARQRHYQPQVCGLCTTGAKETVEHVLTDACNPGRRVSSDTAADVLRLINTQATRCRSLPLWFRRETRLTTSAHVHTHRSRNLSRSTKATTHSPHRPTRRDWRLPPLGENAAPSARSAVG
jgi:hypothetical protein